MKIKLFETKGDAVTFVRGKTGWSVAKSTRHVNQHLFRTDESNRCWINVDDID